MSTSLLRVIWSVTGPYKKYAVFLLILLIVSAVFDSLSLVMILPVLEVLLNHENSRYYRLMQPVLSWFPSSSHLFVVCGLCFLLIVFKNILVLYRAWVSKSFIGKLRLYWSSHIFDNCLYSHFIWYLKQKQGVILENVLYEPNYASKCFRDLIDLVNMAFIVLCLTASLLFLNWQVTVLTFVVGLFICLVQWRYTSKHSSSIGKEKILLNQGISGMVAESIAGVRQVKLFAMEKSVARIFHGRMERLMQLLVRLGVIQELPNAIGEVAIVGLILSILLYYIYELGVPFSEIVPFIGMFVIAANRLSMNLGKLLSQRVSVLSFMPSLQLVDDLVHHADIRESSRPGGAIPPFHDCVVFENVDFQYDKSHPVFQSLDLEFKQGKVTALTGPSGSGKSTVCDLLTGLLRPSSGRILVDGRDMEGIDIRGWRDRLGYVSQESFFFNATLRENILSGMPSVGDDDLVRIASLCGAHEFVRDFPGGYDTVIGDSGIRMSVGQRQRIAVMRALVRRPQILILDEVTSSLDSQNEKEILQLIDRLRAEGMTVILVTHRILTLRVTDFIYVMEKGRVVESGAYEDLLRNQNLFSRLDQLSREPVVSS